MGGEEEGIVGRVYFGLSEDSGGEEDFMFGIGIFAVYCWNF